MYNCLGLHVVNKKRELEEKENLITRGREGLRRGQNEGIGVRGGGEGNKFYLLNYLPLLMHPGYNETQRKPTTCVVAKPLVFKIVTL